VRALAYLAVQPAGKLSANDEIAESESIPSAFLGKVLHPLCRDRLLRSRKGVRGGYELMVSPEQIPLLAIVRSVDGEPLRDCLLEDRACSSAHPCELHDSWCQMREQLMKYLERVTLADVVRIRQGRSNKDFRVLPPAF
jgi:Rrf2 family protein